MVPDSFLPVALNEAQQLVWFNFENITITDPFFSETITRAKIHHHPERQHIITTPLEYVLHIDHPVPPDALVLHISRCGSTLLSQQWAVVPRIRVISEAALFNQLLTDPAIADHMRIALLQACSHIYRQHAPHCIIKCDAWHILHYPLLRKAFPNTPFIALFRNPYEVLCSHQRLPGMHMIPGVLTRHELPIALQSNHYQQLWEYREEVLWALFKALLEIAKDCTMIQYNEEFAAAVEYINSRLSITLNEEEVIRMRKRGLQHSKHPQVEFREQNAAVAKTVRNDLQQLYKELQEHSIIV